MNKTSEMVVQMVLEGRSDREIAEKLGALARLDAVAAVWAERERRDRLVRASTAFGCWDELIGALESGYVPTLRANESAEVDELVRLIQAEGFQVWRGTDAKREELSALQAWAEAELEALYAALVGDDEADEGPGGW